jgi:hypothetical protein
MTMLSDVEDIRPMKVALAIILFFVVGAIMKSL